MAEKQRPHDGHGWIFELALVLAAVFAGLYLLKHGSPAVGAIFAEPAPQVIAALAVCPPPSEHEQMHVVVRQQADGALVAECLHIGSAGTYRRRK